MKNDRQRLWAECVRLNESASNAAPDQTYQPQTTAKIGDGIRAALAGDTDFSTLGFWSAAPRKGKDAAGEAC